MFTASKSSLLGIVLIVVGLVLLVISKDFLGLTNILYVLAYPLVFSIHDSLRFMERNKGVSLLLNNYYPKNQRVIQIVIGVISCIFLILIAYCILTNNAFSFYYVFYVIAYWITSAKFPTIFRKHDLDYNTNFEELDYQEDVR